MRGDKEKECLETVKLIFNCCKGSYWYGVSEDNKRHLMQKVNEASENPESNDFPDFIFDSGFIEHFQITSSKETRKGAKQIKRDKQDEAQLQKGVERAIQSGYQGIVRNLSYFVSGHNYENLEYSFKKNFENHIDSLRKWDGNQEIGIFLIEYTDMALNMGECLTFEQNDGTRISEVMYDYYLSRDNNLLEYLQQYKSEIKFVIFKNSEVVEIIDVSKVEEIIKMQNEYLILPVHGISSYYAVGI